MRCTTPIIIVAILSSVGFGAATTQPAVTVVAKAQPQVAVFPFVNAGPTDATWMAQALEENFVAELSRGGIVSPVRAVADKGADGAMKTAKNSGATYVLSGAYQLLGDEVRVTGQIVAVSDGHAVGGLTATGEARDLFTIEDTLATQAKRLLEPSTGPITALPRIQASGPVAMGNGPVVSNDFSASAYQPAAAFGPQYQQYYYYSNPNDYGDYLYGGPIIVGGGFGYGGYGYGGRGGYRGGFGFHGGFGGRGHVGWGGGGVVGHAGW